MHKTGTTEADTRSEMRKICRIEGDLRATTTTGKMRSTTPALTHQIPSLLRNRSLDAVETMADWRLSNAEVLSDTTIISTIPTTQAGSCPKKRKKAMEPDCGGSPGQTPAQAAKSPDEPISVNIINTITVAIEIPILRSLSVFEAKVRIQNPFPENS